MRILKNIYKSRELIFQLAWREIAGRYRGSFAGLLWSLLNPLFTLGMYTFVFGVVFKNRWGLREESTIDYALILFAGLIIHSLLAECIGRAPFLIIGNPNYVKQVVFPIEILPVVALVSSLFNAAINIGLLLFVWYVVHGGLSLAVISVPFLLFPLCLIALGVGWFLSAATVFFRDISQIVNFLSVALLFFSPIFYSVDKVPESLQMFLEINPLTFIIEGLRGVLIVGSFPDVVGYLIYLALSVLFACGGSIWFEKTRPGFADVL